MKNKKGTKAKQIQAKTTKKNWYTNCLILKAKSQEKPKVYN